MSEDALETLAMTNMPVTAESTPTRTKEMVLMRSALMPAIRATSRFPPVAKAARPKVVRRNTNSPATTRTISSRTLSTTRTRAPDRPDR